MIVSLLLSIQITLAEILVAIEALGNRSRVIDTENSEAPW
jgi:hypothetical protein